MPLEHHRGSAGEFHARPIPHVDTPVVWWFEVDRPAIALGSRQREDVVDLEAAGAAGVEVVRRNSGGGAVLLVPGEIMWVDVVVPVDVGESTDVRRSMVWMGECWRRALHRSIGGDGVADLTVHDGSILDTAWSELVCFAGVGPGEVLLAGRKLVGVSQRRTRSAARYQCAIHVRHDPERLVGLLAPPAPDPAELPPVAVIGDVPGIDPDRLVAALVTEVGGTVSDR